MKFSIVVAVDSKRGIGKNNALPWHLPGDLKHFKQITSTAEDGKQNAVIMGRKTWDSIPLKFRPLPNRLNIVLTRQESFELPAKCKLAGTLDEAMKNCPPSEISEIFVIGGAELYDAALQHPQLGKIYLTEVKGDFDCDRFFPEYSDFKLLSHSESYTENGIEYSFKIIEPTPQVKLNEVGVQ